MKKTKTKRPKIYFFEDKPLFGMDIGHGSLRVMQLEARKHKKPHMIGYGTTAFDPKAIVDGVIEKPELVASAALDMFKHHLVGDITTKRVAISLPAAKAFTRAIELPKMSAKQVDTAVRTEVEQYIPIHTDDLYLDYTPLRTQDEITEYFVVAMPKVIIDSYLNLTRMLGLEAVLFQTSIGAGAELFARDSHSDVPAVLVDFGNETADITVYDHGLVVSGTVDAGGERITKLIADALDVTTHEAIIIKTKYGLDKSKKQKQIEEALAPELELLIKEIRRTIRYYEERYSSKRSIGQVIIMGGGANLPGLAAYLTNSLRLAVRAADPSTLLDFGHLQPFNRLERMSYVTAAGLSIVNPAEVFA